MDYVTQIELQAEREREQAFDRWAEGQKEHYHCCICEELHSEEHAWLEPHPVARKMQDSESFVCSNECLDDWLREFSEECKEYELEKAHARHADELKSIADKWDYIAEGGE